MIAEFTYTLTIDDEDVDVDVDVDGVEVRGIVDVETTTVVPPVPPDLIGVEPTVIGVPPVAFARN